MAEVDLHFHTPKSHDYANKSLSARLLTQTLIALHATVTYGPARTE